MAGVDFENLAFQHLATAKKQKQQNMSILLEQEKQLVSGSESGIMSSLSEVTPVPNVEPPPELHELIQELQQKKENDKTRYSHLGDAAEKMFFKLQNAFDSIPTEMVGPEIDG